MATIVTVMIVSSVLLSLVIISHTSDITEGNSSTTISSLLTTSSSARTASGLGYGCQSMCCEGRDNTCHSTGVRINGRGSVTSKCFCDEGCPDMGDCCFDYHTACTVVDCKVSNWTAWSQCSSECGVGTKSRHRTILVQPRFGGEECPTNLKETTICNGNQCLTQEVETDEELEKETAKIMPAKFGRFRNMRMYNANMDIRKNLFNQYYQKDVKQYSGYCSRFRVVSSRRACVSYITPWSNVLRSGAIICVECQQTAMEKERSNGVCAGHGEVGVRTNWNAVTASGCTGWWERLEDDKECSCGQKNSHNFIFV